MFLHELAGVALLLPVLKSAFGVRDGGCEVFVVVAVCGELAVFHLGFFFFRWLGGVGEDGRLCFSVFCDRLGSVMVLLVKRR